MNKPLKVTQPIFDHQRTGHMSTPPPAHVIATVITEHALGKVAIKVAPGRLVDAIATCHQRGRIDTADTIITLPAEITGLTIPDAGTRTADNNAHADHSGMVTQPRATAQTTSTNKVDELREKAIQNLRARLHEQASSTEGAKLLSNMTAETQHKPAITATP